ncbi:T9SS type B sorting domain-containing protein, partial [bacterium]|nr:T9SS type B sorting domain-containing protein [bacterium]
PPSPPPFRNVVWQFGYNTANQMSGDPILSINSATGELTVTPTITGQFVIGVKVIEYRKGKIVGETLRDYQVNVMDCDFDVIANFTTEKGSTSGKAFVFECSDTVQFVDRSYKAVHYRWNFGDPTTDADTSNETDPWYIYPGNGNYKVTLKVKNELCEDEYSFTVKVRSKQTFKLGPDVVLCDDISYFFDSKAYDATSIQWNTGETSRAISVNDTGMYWATVAFGECVWSDTAHVGANPVEITDNKDSLFCIGETIDYTVDAGYEGYRYKWRPGAKTDTFQTFNITNPGLYELVVYNEHCFKIDTINVVRASDPEIPDVFYCNEFEHVVDPGSFKYAEYLWSTNSQNQSETFTEPGKYWYQLKQKHCLSADTFVIENSVVSLELGDDTHFCDEINVTLDAGPNKTTYDWSTNQSSRTIQVTQPGEYWVTASDEFGCSRSDTVVFTLSNSPTIDLGNDTTICVRSPIVLSVKGDFAEYAWSTEETSSTIEVMLADEYILKVTDEFGCIAIDTVSVSVDPDALPNELFVPNAFSPNDDGLNDVFPYSEYVPQSEFYVMVFTRWGEKVFDSREDGTQHWDGTYKGKIVPNQTFIYYVQYRACDGNVRIRKGTVNPLR